MKINKTIINIVFLINFLTFTSCEKQSENSSEIDNTKEETIDEADNNTNNSLEEGSTSLAELINQYRKNKGLSEIPVSKSLTKVAQLHVKDLVDNQPVNGTCNLHSWSDKGSWSACCYTSDHSKASCMWDKPRELTSYTGNGYEIAAWYSQNITASKALEVWKTSESHHNTILNRGMWANLKWQAVGTAIYKGYAVVWFGEKLDKN